MKKYRLTKITVRTREVVSLSNTNANANELQNAVCPVCHAPLAALLPAAENAIIQANIERRRDEPPLEESCDRHDRKLIED